MWASWKMPCPCSVFLKSLKSLHSDNFWNAHGSSWSLIRLLPWGTLLEEEMVAHSSSLAWKIQWTEEPGEPQSMGSRRVGHGWTHTLGSPWLWETWGYLCSWHQTPSLPTLTLPDVVVFLWGTFGRLLASHVPIRTLPPILFFFQFLKIYLRF